MLLDLVSTRLDRLHSRNPAAFPRWPRFIKLPRARMISSSLFNRLFLVISVEASVTAARKKFQNISNYQGMKRIVQRCDFLLLLNITRSLQYHIYYVLSHNGEKISETFRFEKNIGSELRSRNNPKVFINSHQKYSFSKQ